MSNAASEWELLCIVDDIELGDTLRVEVESVCHDMLLVEENFGSVVLVDRSGARRTFKASTLEEIDGPGFILEKSHTLLRASDVVPK